MPSYSKELLERIKVVTNKRAKYVLDAIVKSGSVTTEQISAAGYDHPPRAAQDVRDLGFPLLTIKTKHSNGRSIAAYTLDESDQNLKKSGRLALPKKLRQEIIETSGEKCQLCGATENLQIDHRVPFAVAGETLQADDNPYQVLCGSCNRKKSWACEHCPNLLKLKNIKTCKTCYWASSQVYTHVAMEKRRRVELVWMNDEVKDFDLIRSQAQSEGTTVEVLIKKTAKARLGK
jgi:hypothetical protein